MRNIEYDISISVNNLKVSFSDNGLNGVPVLILIHGFPFNKSMWYNQMTELVDDFRVISPVPPVFQTYSKLVPFLSRVCSRGWDFGGWLAPGAPAV